MDERKMIEAEIKKLETDIFELEKPGRILLQKKAELEQLKSKSRDLNRQNQKPDYRMLKISCPACQHIEKVPVSFDLTGLGNRQCPKCRQFYYFSIKGDKILVETKEAYAIRIKAKAKNG